MADPKKPSTSVPIKTAPDQLDTGTGGFGIDDKVYTYDVGLADSEGGSHGKFNKGRIKVDDSKKDLPKPTRQTLAEYLSDVTLGKRGSAKVPNSYPVGHNVKLDTPITDEKGQPPALVDPTAQNSPVFAGSVPNSYSQDYTQISSDIKKGKSSQAPPKAVDGHALLPGAKDSPAVKRYTSAVLNHNRFTADGAHMIDTNVGNPAADYNPSLPTNKEKGTSEGGKYYSMGRLASIGPTLTMRAGIELGSGTDKFNPNSTAAAAGALLPGVAQLAVRRIENQMLTAKDVLATLTNDEVPSANVISPGSLSWGQLNNTEDQWSGITAIGMAALSTAMIAGLLLIIEGFSVILGMITPQVKHATHDAQGRYALGQYYAGERKKDNGGLLGAATALLSLDIGSLLGIKPTNFPFSAALKKGSKAFFGIDDSGGVLGTLAGAASKGFGPDAGFNTIVARSIVRSTLTIVDQISKIGGNPINIVKQIMGLIEVLRVSKIIAACNVFAQLGDAILSVPEKWVDSNAVGGLKLSFVEEDASKGIRATVVPSRLKNDLTLAWAGYRARTLLLVPPQVKAGSHAAVKLGAFDTTPGYWTSEDGRDRVKVDVGDKNAGGRISSDLVAELEQKMDSEYVPFYFHDVRTNEIVSFHAFLASLNDDYTANYETMDAYGRGDPVKIYKNTSRRIGMSFYVIATSMPDFEMMWVKINKLVTMLYPQYTAGKQLQDKDGKYVFTQPFSQMPGASPLIRIRLGDLIKSNYSRFGLARLFGLGNPKFTLDGKTFADVEKIENADIEKILKAYQDAGKDKSDLTFIPESGGVYNLSNEKKGGLSPSVSIGEGGDGPEFAPYFFPSNDLFAVKVDKVLDNGMAICVVDVNDKEVTDYGLTTAKVKAKYDDKDNFMLRFIGGKYLIPVSKLRPTKAAIDKLHKDVVSADEFGTTLGEFLDVEKNAIAKSFKDTGGKGLAGFIESMNFDWYDKVTWETDWNRTAPKMCKVTIQFAPIHDIAPGLDHFGYNRAPVYPVGLMAQRREPPKK